MTKRKNKDQVVLCKYPNCELKTNMYRYWLKNDKKKILYYGCHNQDSTMDGHLLRHYGKNKDDKYEEFKEENIMTADMNDLNRFEPKSMQDISLS